MSLSSQTNFDVIKPWYVTTSIEFIMIENVLKNKTQLATINRITNSNDLLSIGVEKWVFQIF